MKLDDLNKEKLMDARTISIVGRIIEGNKGDYIMIKPCFCSKSSSKDMHICNDSLKLLIHKSDIIGEIETNIKSLKEKDKKLSKVVVNKNSNVVLEYSSHAKVAQIFGQEPFISPEIMEHLCYLFPFACKKSKDRPPIPRPLPEDTIMPYILGAGWGPALGMLVGFGVGLIKDALDDDCTTVKEVSESTGPNGEKIITTRIVKTCK